jgi:hypothetical protein
VHTAAALASAVAWGALVGACAQNPGPAAPDPQAAPAARPAPAAATPAPVPAPEPVTDLAGEWDFVATLGGESVGGTLTLTRADTVYRGSAVAHEGEVYPLISLTLTGPKIVMLFETPSGAARVECTLTGFSELKGALLMGDQTGTFSARKN